MGLVSINTCHAARSGVPGLLLYLLFLPKKKKRKEKEKPGGFAAPRRAHAGDKEVGGDFFLSYIKVEEQAHELM